MSANPDYSNTPASPRRPQYNYAPGDINAPPAVSIVTPFFNTGSVFHETAKSVVRQSLQQWEWIIVDDGSDAPDSVSVLDAYASKDPRIRVVRSSGRVGPAAARNLGVSLARAPYIAFIDSDDLYEPTALEKWLWFLERHGQYAMVKGFQVGFGAEEYVWSQGFHSGAAVLESNVIQTACMIRREVYGAVGGMDETIRGGMEDWDFWLRCADAGHWGGTIPEVLDWYRRRPSHSDRWEDWDASLRQAAFREQLRRRYPRVFANHFPQPEGSYSVPYSEISPPPTFENRLARSPGVERTLLLVPHFVMGGSDKFNLDLIAQLTAKHSFEITIATTRASKHPWRNRFEALTPDIFTLDTFLGLRDYPAFLVYLIRSRQIDSVLLSHSQLGYQLLPYLRSECPWIRCFDYVHIEEPTWKSGGYPAYSLTYRHFLDQSISSSRYLRDWMIARGGHPGRISVVTTNIDPEEWTRSKFDLTEVRKKWDVPEGTPVILFTGRLCAQKQPDVLARVLLELRDRNLPFLCLVAGDGEQGPWLRQFVAGNGLNQVRLLGARSSEEVRELLAISDIFFLPSLHEGISLAAYEAMAMEAAVVGADVGGQKEVLTPECSILVAPGEHQVARYASALAALLEDRPRREAMASAARKRVATEFRLDDMGQRMAEVLSSGASCPTFDIHQAMQALAPAFAREIIEQSRVELIADELWAKNQLPAFDVPGPVRQPSWWISFKRATLNPLVILRPALAGRSHRRNRRLLYSTLKHSESRRQLLGSFDRDFYCSQNADIPSFGPFPLLHYVFFGFQEGRHPSLHFHSDSSFRGVSDAFPDVNPLLWSCVRRWTAKPLEDLI